jgi:hypothetical protein
MSVATARTKLGEPRLEGVTKGTPSYTGHDGHARPRRDRRPGSSPSAGSHNLSLSASTTPPRKASAGPPPTTAGDVLPPFRAYDG